MNRSKVRMFALLFSREVARPDNLWDFGHLLYIRQMDGIGNVEGLYLKIYGEVAQLVRASDS